MTQKADVASGSREFQPDPACRRRGREWTGVSRALCTRQGRRVWRRADPAAEVMSDHLGTVTGFLLSAPATSPRSSTPRTRVPRRHEAKSTARRNSTSPASRAYQYLDRLALLGDRALAAASRPSAAAMHQHHRRQQMPGQTVATPPARQSTSTNMDWSVVLGGNRRPATSKPVKHLKASKGKPANAFATNSGTQGAPSGSVTAQTNNRQMTGETWTGKK